MSTEALLAESARNTSPELPFLELAYFNGLGGF